MVDVWQSFALSYVLKVAQSSVTLNATTTHPGEARYEIRIESTQETEEFRRYGPEKKWSMSDNRLLSGMY